MKPNETDKLDPYERFCVGAFTLLAFATVFGLAMLVCGCYSNTGSSTAVGDITALPEISDAADNLCVKVYYSMTGARVWTAKDSLVKITYANDYTNRYCGVIETRGNQRLAVEIEPLAEAGDLSCAAGATDAQAEGSGPAPAASCPCKSGGVCKCAPGECRCAAANAAASAASADTGPAAPAPSGATPATAATASASAL